MRGLAGSILMEEVSNLQGRLPKTPKPSEPDELILDTDPCCTAHIDAEPRSFAEAVLLCKMFSSLVHKCLCELAVTISIPGNTLLLRFRIF